MKIGYLRGLGVLVLVPSSGLFSGNTKNLCYFLFSSVKTGWLDENPEAKEIRKSANAELEACMQALQIIGMYLYMVQFGKRKAVSCF
jgi:hypothetical protein